ncbi:hypothetical protein KP509_06G064300 [Ceratopteris richardii]|uniref:Uncharacterized protein n=2 Tax=Ceratopteris richardii TaxID=49495 RepID=A0A8T2UGR8_CERRI|nr:hypothetical protein KP509_06G064300 [Ceratopteris richardii]
MPMQQKATMIVPQEDQDEDNGARLHEKFFMHFVSATEILLTTLRLFPLLALLLVIVVILLALLLLLTVLPLLPVILLLLVLLALLFLVVLLILLFSIIFPFFTQE